MRAVGGDGFVNSVSLDRAKTGAVAWAEVCNAEPGQIRERLVCFPCFDDTVLYFNYHGLPILPVLLIENKLRMRLNVSRGRVGKRNNKDNGHLRHTTKRFHR